VFNRELGLSPWDYLNRFRIYQAQELLRRTNESIRSIARQVGFKDPAYFSRVFRNLMGVSRRRFGSIPKRSSISAYPKSPRHDARESDSASFLVPHAFVVDCMSLFSNRCSPISKPPLLQWVSIRKNFRKTRNHASQWGEIMPTAKGLDDSEPEISDDVWARIAPILPPLRRKNRKGRPRMNDRQAMVAIWYKLHTGCSWKALPRELGAAALFMTVSEWQAAGVFDQLLQAGILEYDAG